MVVCWKFDVPLACCGVSDLGLKERDCCFMDCKETQKLFIPFIDDQLNVKELEGFLHHMEGCKECREEYEIYYMLIMGMRYLEEDSAKGSNWTAPEEKLQSAQDYIFKYHILRWEKLAILLILCIGVVFLL